MNNIDKNATYFCYDAYSTAGRPKMEAELFDWARTLVLYRTIKGDFVDDLVADLWHRQEFLMQDHRNWKPTRIDYRGDVDLFWLNIGETHLSFRRVLGAY